MNKVELCPTEGKTMDLEILLKLVWTCIHFNHRRWPWRWNWMCTAAYLEKLFTSTGLGMVHWKWLDIFTGMNLTHSLPYTVQSCDNELESADKTGNWNTLQWCVDWLGGALDVAMAMEDTYWKQELRTGYQTRRWARKMLTTIKGSRRHGKEQGGEIKHLLQDYNRLSRRRTTTQ